MQSRKNVLFYFKMYLFSEIITNLLRLTIIRRKVWEDLRNKLMGNRVETQWDGLEDIAN